MANITERILDLERRMLFLEEQMGIESIDDSIPVKKTKSIKIEKEPEKTINGFTKDQLKTMFTWAKSMRIDQLSKNDFEELQKWGVLKDFFPNAPEKYEDIIL